MIRKLSITDIPQVARIHKQELSGFLPELGLQFLENFYKASLDIPEMFTLVEKKNEQILGFVSGIESAKGLYKKVIFKNPIGFAILFLRYFVTHPEKIVKMVKILSYPGFADDSPELLTIAVKKDYQKRGIGKNLFQKTVEEFTKRKIKKFKISVYDKLPANGFYKKIGCKFVNSFEFLGEKMNYYSYEIKILNPKSQVPNKLTPRVIPSTFDELSVNSVEGSLSLSKNDSRIRERSLHALRLVGMTV
ncbi:GNAT family N-acetyltransferase [Candidatus Gottesmanbacteria bacterium]|nr:GNAT family N-acetyltransferase [Candidatus Gottesmanbacteria bacterium]